MTLRWPDELAGPPLHPLVVHLAVVLIPERVGAVGDGKLRARSKRWPVDRLRGSGGRGVRVRGPLERGAVAPDPGCSVR